MTVIFPIPIIIVIEIKNSIPTATTQQNIINIDVLISFMHCTNSLSTIGCINALEILYMANIENIFTRGNKQISNNTISPTMLIPFFIIKEQLTTVSKASDKKSPMIGTKLSTANLAVFAANPSKDEAAKP